MRQFAAILLLLSAVVSLLGSEAFGQGRGRVNRYRSPSGPTITPYLDYFRNEPFSFGIQPQLDPYNTFVNPRRMLTETQRQQTDEITNLQRQNRDLASTMQKMRQVQASPTGKRATFMNYSGFYPGASGRGR